VKACVNDREGVVRVDGHEWPFELDCRVDALVVSIGDRKIRIRRFTWRQKRTLARFAQLGEDFLKLQFLRVSLAEDVPLPEDEAEREALWALARWLNAPDGSYGLPLDKRLLASVTLELCQAMHLAPSAFENLEAGEVELLWQAARGGMPQSAEQSAGTRIVVVPDPEKADSKTADHAEAREEFPEDAAKPVAVSKSVPERVEGQEQVQVLLHGAPPASMIESVRSNPGHLATVLNSGDVGTERTEPRVRRPERAGPRGSPDRFRVMMGPARKEAVSAAQPAGNAPSPARSVHPLSGAAGEAPASPVVMSSPIPRKAAQSPQFVTASGGLPAAASAFESFRTKSEPEQAQRSFPPATAPWEAETRAPLNGCPEASAFEPSRTRSEPEQARRSFPPATAPWEAETRAPLNDCPEASAFESFRTKSEPEQARRSFPSATASWEAETRAPLNGFPEKTALNQGLPMETLIDELADRLQEAASAMGVDSE
jgi:hypothetical protein